MAGATYASVVEYKDWVHITDSLDDDTIERALLAGSRGVDNFCDTRFSQTAAGTARLFDTCDPRWVRIGDVVAVTEVATDPNRDGVFGTLTFPSPTKRLGLIRVTGTWGWPAVPDAVVQSTLLVAHRLVKRKDSPEGVTGFDQFGTVRISTRDDPDAVRYLTPYRTKSRRGGWAFA
jgi:hypothetical protein